MSNSQEEGGNSLEQIEETPINLKLGKVGHSIQNMDPDDKPSVSLNGIDNSNEQLTGRANETKDKKLSVIHDRTVNSLKIPDSQN